MCSLIYFSCVCFEVQSRFFFIIIIFNNYRMHFFSVKVADLFIIRFNLCFFCKRFTRLSIRSKTYHFEVNVCYWGYSSIDAIETKNGRGWCLIRVCHATTVIILPDTDILSKRSPFPSSLLLQRQALQDTL